MRNRVADGLRKSVTDGVPAQEQTAFRAVIGDELLRIEALPRVADRPLPQFRCTGCGYGASRRMAPERCPMCGGSTWEHAEPKWIADVDAPLQWRAQRDNDDRRRL
jgi:rubrerythrin